MNANVETLANNIARLRGDVDHGDVPWIEEEYGLQPSLPSFQRVVEVCACPVLIVSAAATEQSIVYASPAFLRLTGYYPMEVLGRRWTAVFAHGEGDTRPEVLRAAIKRELQTQGLLSIKNGSVMDLRLEVTLTPLRNEVGFVTHYVASFHDVTAERRRREDLEYRAYYDHLTGLANRHLLADRFDLALAHARRHQVGFALALLDLDEFKQINDRHGHDTGDSLLQAVGTRLKGIVREEDTVARLGGDEFVLLLTDTKDYESVEGVLGRVRSAFSQPIQLDSGPAAVTCCAGVARCPQDGVDLKSVLKAADVRLYEAKGRR